MRRMAAATIVVALLAAAVGAGFLFDVDDSTSDGVQSVYATALGSASRCPPRSGAFSEPGGNDSVDAIASDVERLRDLGFSSEPEIDFLSEDELAEHVADSARAELNEDTAEVEMDALKLIGLVPDDFDIDDLISGASQQVLGLYDPKQRELLVGNSGSFDPLGQLTIAHELSHALTDEVLGFPDLRFSPEKADEQLAQRALIEGDATLLMQHYGLVEFPDDLEEALGGSGSPAQQSAYAELPHYVQRSFAFPYQEGFFFACELYARGGWRAVDDAYRSPPTSTLEILFPDLYGEFDPTTPAEPNDPPDGWDKVEEVAVGAVDLQWMFEAPGGNFSGGVAEAARQVSRWRGGLLHIWQQDEALTVAMSIVEGQDLTGGDSLSLCDRLIRWYSESQPDATFLPSAGTKAAWTLDDHAVAVDCEGDQTRFVAAPDLDTAVHVAEFR